MSDLLSEYKKCIACVILLIFLLVSQHVSGQDMSGWINSVMNGLVTIFFAGAVRYSVLKTSDRNFINRSK